MRVLYGSCLLVALISIFVGCRVDSNSTPNGVIVVLSADAPFPTLISHHRRLFFSGREDGRYPNTIHHVYPHLHAYFAEVDPRTLKQLRNRRDVLFVEEDSEVHIADVQTKVYNWGLDRIDARSGLDQTYHYPHSAGSSVTVFIIDTGRPKLPMS